MPQKAEAQPRKVSGPSFEVIFPVNEKLAGQDQSRVQFNKLYIMPRILWAA